MKKVAIIQARMGASRLPGKMLMPLGGVPVIQHAYDRACRIEGLDGVLVATSDAANDNALVDYCREHEIHIFRGSEEDVLDRYYRAACSVKADAIMRITGDCPFLDPTESAKVLDAFLHRPGCEYACNIEPPFLPDGLDTEVIKFPALESLWREVTDAECREHVTLYIRRHLSEFNAVCLTGEQDLSRHRWTLDHPEDLQFLAAVVEKLRERKEFGFVHEILAVITEYPHLAQINAGIKRNEKLSNEAEE